MSGIFIRQIANVRWGRGKKRKAKSLKQKGEWVELVSLSPVNSSFYAGT
jgi:hypothetical protein